jgi:hypothetical protein
VQIQKESGRFFERFHNVNLDDGEGILPGEELVTKGLADLAQREISDCSLLVLVAGPRLRALGIEVPMRPLLKPYEHALYARLEQRLGTGAHSYYNSLLRRMASYAHALEREQSRSAL